MPNPTREPYLVRSVVHASQILRRLPVAGRGRCGCGTSCSAPASARACASGCCTPSTTAGCWRRWTRTGIASISEIRRRKRYRIGYAAQGQDSSFPREVHASLQRAAEREDVELIVVNNRYQPKVALRNAEHLIRERVDLVIEFQTDEAVAPAIASKYLEAEHPAHRHRHSPPGRHLLRRQQLPGGAARRTLSRAMGAHALGRQGRRGRAAGARRARARSCTRA